MMIKQAVVSSNPDVERLIREMLAENSRYERELRSVHRENLVFPVTIVLPEGKQPIHGFSRNVSVTGVCILSDTEVISGIYATLEIYRLQKPDPSLVLSECRWCRPFGDKYYASGWQFSNLTHA